MLVSSVSQHIWSLKLRKEDGSALKCMSGLRAGVWWVRLEVLINHTEPSSAFSLSFIPLCRSGDRSGVTLSCNKCFEGRRPDIVFEITRPVCVYVRTPPQSFSGTDLLFIYYIYSITHTLSCCPGSPESTLPLPLYFYVSQIGYKNRSDLHSVKMLTGLSAVDYTDSSSVSLIELLYSG